MKLECPYCWQHYEINATDRDQDFVCLCCEQTFNGKDALLLPESGGGERKWCRILLAAVVLLVIFNLFLWWQCGGQERKTTNATEFSVSALPPSLERDFAELRERQTRLEEQVRALQEELRKLQLPDGDRRAAE